MKTLKKVELEKVAGGITQEQKDSITRHMGAIVGERDVVVGTRYVFPDKFIIGILVDSYEESSLYGSTVHSYRVKVERSAGDFWIGEVEYLPAAYNRAYEYIE